MHQYKAKEIMSTDLITVSADENIFNADKLLKKNHIRQLPVCNNTKLIGIITDRDIRQALGTEIPANSKIVANSESAKTKIVKDYMTPNPYTITPDTPIEKAVTIIKEKKIGSLPVCNLDNELLGIITITDISCLLINILNEKAKESL